MSGLKIGEVGSTYVRDPNTQELVYGWFMATTQNSYGVFLWSTPVDNYWKRTCDTGDGLWMLSGMAPVPPEKWPEEVFVAVAKEGLLYAS